MATESKVLSSDTSRRSKFLASGIYVGLHNTSGDTILVETFQVTGRLTGDCRVYVSRSHECNLQESGLLWDWRRFIEVARVENLGESLTEPMALKLRVPVPMRPGDSRIFYLFAHNENGLTQTILSGKDCGFYVRKSRRLVASDAALEMMRLCGNHMIPFAIFTQQAGSLVKILLVPAVGLVGGVQYRSLNEVQAATAVELLASVTFSLADVERAEINGIGSANRHLICEWTGQSMADPLLTLALPGSGSNGRRKSSILVPIGSSVTKVQGMPNWQPTAAELDMLWTRNVACRELWQRFLSRSAHGVEGWLAEVRAVLLSEAACERVSMRRGLLQQALTRQTQSAGAVGDSAGQGSRWKVLRNKLRRGVLASLVNDSRKALQSEIRALVMHEVHEVQRGMEGGSASEPPPAAATPTARRTELKTIAARIERYLMGRLARFHASPEGWCCRRLWNATPQATGMGSFTLIRRYGKGSFGQVFAARKEDTMALFALKMVLSKRGNRHLKIERNVLERAAKAGSPFLCSLRYAFRAGSWFVLVLPMLSGGTLQVRLDEATTAGGGLPLEQVAWYAAQLGLALEALHCLGMIHRDVKPSNVLISSDGYLQLSDFGLSGKPGSPSKSGTRGYWAPETVRKEPQGEAADWWSLGVVVWYLATGTHPFHLRWQRPQDSDAPPAPWEATAEVDAADGHRHRASSAVSDVEVGDSGDNSDERLQQARLTERELNYNTLHMPLELPREVPSALSDLILGFLQRDPHERLGSSGFGDIRAHAFFGAQFEWELMEQQQLAAPYIPDPMLVYAKDVVPTLSGSLEVPPDELLSELSDWDCALPAGYDAELREFVRKSSTQRILQTMEAPSELTAELPKENKGDGELSTHELLSSHSHSDTGTGDNYHSSDDGSEGG